MIDYRKVMTGGPDQLVSGAIWSGPPMVPYQDPEDFFISTPPEGFTDSGYISEDGLKFSQDRSTKDLVDWGGSIVKKILESFTGTLEYGHLEVNEFSLRETFGDSNVTEWKAAAAAHGRQLKTAVNAKDLPRKARWYRIKEGDAKIVLLAPNCQVTEVGDIEFKNADAVVLPNIVSCFQDDLGNSLYIVTDDGIYAATATPGDGE